MRKANEPPVSPYRRASLLRIEQNPVRFAALRALDCQAGAASLNFSLIGASLRDFARTLSRRRRSWDDLPADLIGYAMRQQVRSMHWSQAMRRTVLAALRARATGHALG